MNTLPATCGLAAVLTLAAGFRSPSAVDRLRALGPLDGLPAGLRRLFEPGPDFEPLPAPGLHDWLAMHPESGQTFAEFATARRGRGRIRGKIVIVVLGAFDDPLVPSPDTLREFAAAYFCLPAEVHRIPQVEFRRFTTRINRFTGRRQVLTGDVLAFLRRRRPADAAAVLAVTLEDLYPDASWNFVFGQASPSEGLAVSSFCRYLPAFTGEPVTDDSGRVVRLRAFRVTAHELGHLFGLAHCIWYRCIMNGSNHLAESDARPLHLCPVDLRKLQWLIGFDPVARYRRLHRFYRRIGLEAEAAWIQQRLMHIGAGSGPPAADR